MVNNRHLAKYPYPIEDNPNEVHIIVQDCTSQKEQSNCSLNEPLFDSHADPTDMPDHALTKMPNITTCDLRKYSNLTKHNELTEYNNEPKYRAYTIPIEKKLKKKLSYLKDHVTEEY
ncbi:hypothetical protein GJ496_001930 [Pomphorhynchus laevis]|nr:hypothetical protein GJ496_001930 [Pomphorhynchus laevis]